MPQIHGIREMSREGYSVAEISRRREVHQKTVRKCLKQDDFSPRPPKKALNLPRKDGHGVKQRCRRGMTWKEHEGSTVGSSRSER